MARRLPPAVFAGFVACAILVAAGANAQAPVTPKPAPAFLALKPGEIDPIAITPAPPADDSPQTLADLAELRDIQATRTAERLDQAQWDANHEDASAFAQTLGPAFDLSVLPQTAKLLAIVRNDEAILADRAKDKFLRKRPFVLDSTLVGCERSTIKPLSSYPSGHATFAYSFAAVLIDLMPDKAAAIAARADDFAYSRLVCGVHYRTDIRAGRILGDWVVADLMADPGFDAQFDAARRELIAAHLTQP